MAEPVLPYEAVLLDLIKIVTSKDDKYKRPGYKQTVDHADEMAVHLYGDKPEVLLNRVRPREDPEITKYRLESYEPTTKSTAEKGVSLVNKIFNPKLYAIKPAEGANGKKLYEYATIEYPVFNSVVNFLSEYGLKKTLADPNGVFVVEPRDIPKELTEQIEPFIFCYPSKDIYLVGADYLLIFLYEDKDDNGVPIYHFKWVDKLVITNFLLTSSNRKDWETEVESSYNHDIGEIPAWHLGGVYDQHSSHKTGHLYESFFYPAVPFWNKAINAESDLDGAFISHIHPQKWEVAEECEFVSYTDHGDFACSGGYIHDPSIKGGKSKCSACGGSGRKSVKGPHSVYWVAKDKLNDPNGSLNQPPGGYLDVPTAATQMLVDRVDRLMEDGLSALAMDIVNKIGNNQSGEAKAYDRTELFDFLGKVRDLFYDKHLKNIFYFFSKYMFIGQEPEQSEPTVIKPNDFDIFTTQELTDQLKIAKDSSLNPAYLGVKQIDVQNKEFQQHPDILHELNLIVRLDPFVEIPRADIDLMLIGGTASKIDVIVHDNISPFVRRALEENKDYAGKTYAEKMDVLRAYAEETLDAIKEQQKVEIDQSAIEPESGKPPANVAK